MLLTFNIRSYYASFDTFLKNSTIVAFREAHRDVRNSVHTTHQTLNLTVTLTVTDAPSPTLGVTPPRGHDTHPKTLLSSSY